jgi:glutaredoxin
MGIYMKKKIFISIALIVVLIVSFLFYKLITVMSLKKDLVLGSSIPNISFKSIKNDSISISKLSNKHLAIVYFSIHCPHCHSVLNDLKKKMINTVQFVFVSKESYDEVSKFLYDNKFYNLGLFCFDQENKFLKFFGSSIVPNLFYYKNGLLITNIKGEFSPSVVFKTNLNIE